MKLTFYFLFAFVFQVSASGYSQKISLAFNHEVKLTKVFSAIENQTDYVFFYKENCLKNAKSVAIVANDLLINDVLNKVFENQPLEYKIIDKMIVVRDKADADKNISKIDAVAAINENLPPPIVITGKVTDENGKPLSGASVVVKGTNVGTQTNEQGEFSLNVKEEVKTLIVSYVGYEKNEIVLKGKTNVSVALKATTTQGQDIVVVGYGSQKRADLTSAVSIIKSKDIQELHYSSTAFVLQGKAPGVQVVNNSNSPGGDVSVRVRGVSSLNNSIQPLYVLDGVPLYGNISFLNPNDIAEIDILKDASASAIYGNRGTNGVVLISTKKGKQNQKLEINLNTSISFQNPIRLIKTMGTNEYAQLIKTFNANDGSTLAVPDPSTTSGTDWVKAITNANALFQNYGLSVAGGANKFTFASSINYIDQLGVVKSSDYKRLNFTLNTQYAINDKVKIGSEILFSSSKRNIIVKEGDLWNGVWSNCLTMDPYTPPYKSASELADNTISPNKNIFSIFHAPLYTVNSLNPIGITARNFQYETNTYILGNIWGTYDIVKGIQFKTNVGFENNQYLYYNFNPTFWENPGKGGNLLANNLTKNTNAYTHYNWDNTLTFIKKLNEHSLTVLVGSSYEHYNLNGINGYVSGLPGDDTQYRYLTYGTNGAIVSETIDQSALFSMFGRILYNYKSKYFLSFTDRYDGSSKFSSGKQFGNFPSISLSWNISNEKFFRNSVVNLLKLRLGWGKIGNQNIPSQAFLTTLRNNAYYNFGGTLNTPGYAIQHAGNPNISWETTTDENIGIDFGLLKNKLTGSLDFYNRKVTNLLLAIDPPQFTGLYNVNMGLATGVTTNVGTMQNRGIDLVLNYQDKVGQFTYSIGGNVSTVANKVLNLGTLPYIDAGGGRNFSDYISRTVVGQSVAQFYGYKVLGIFQTQDEINNYTRNSKLIQPNAKPGDFKYATNPNNSAATNLTSGDKYFLGNSIPKFTYGINLSLSYSGFELSAFAYGVSGNNIFETQRALIDNVSNNSNNLRAGLLSKAWHGAGTSNTVPRITAQSNNYSNTSSAFISNGAYLRLNNLNIGYSLNEKTLSKIKLSSLKFYIGVQNLFTISKYDGFDPAISNANILQTGIDFGGYPINRSWTFGLKAGL